ncbi:hypothetical protein LPJ78_003374 [Coemansia sp. RSA 989]|nr:hypothetical protein BX667DRAFT_507875 [Coemansia mojavensis]KAJ1740672.1 hypothetical protein LPJ68_003559 [Coemansia sp. RSA 1086]KAJ1749255.1 hypothetical protein LPJ79_003855 [Coemansia sp. RSA 1821]KAJ1864420.1 hypothetical protein LPJ78_003374 [Coemansia sp. RSA 989]KAJ1871110.1 hypothetical protein LPJ55_004129 [Coemansia sp. RSA 990]KAJ2632794.1 hypothetical protein H4R22_000980 [Coemansia sp. RSA 1290]KAJ2647122.1 hypothetical protein IWW40_004920 [Coemansia sp. RSA 1250]KAJ26689
MVKFFALASAAATLLQSAYAHMSIISPPPRSGVVADEIYAPCGNGNTPTSNITTFAVEGNSEFVLRPGHGTGTLTFSYFTDLTVTNSSTAHLLKEVPVPKPDTYTTDIDFSKANLKSGDHIVVQAVYNATTDGKVELFYACFDVQLADEASSKDEGDATDGLDSTTSGASSISAIGSVVGLLAMAAAF